MRALLSAGVAGLVLACVAVAPNAHAKVDHVERVSYYNVEGDHLDVVMHALDTMGPPDDSGERFHARTDAHIDWNFSLQPVGDGCAVRNVRTKLILTVIMPRLTGADAELAREFSDYTARLMVHETGHVDNARKTAAAIDQALGAVPVAATCKEAKEAANAVGHRVFDEGAARDVAYDRVTDHGRLQGAHFP